MSLSTRVQQIERKLGASVAEAEMARFCNDGVWPTDPGAREKARYLRYFHDAVRMTEPPDPPIGRGVRRRYQERQDMIDRWMEEGTPYDKDALPPLELTEEESSSHDRQHSARGRRHRAGVLRS